MKIIEAKIAGVKAYDAGKGRAPALNKEFTEKALNQTETKFLHLFESYLYGWDIANLASEAIPGAPSLESLKEIMAEARKEGIDV